MRRAPSRPSLFLVSLVLCGPLMAVKPVAAVGKANHPYLERRLVDGKPRRETYVFMEGNCVKGGTLDHSVKRMTFREIAEFLAPQLTQQNYWPTSDVKAADLVLLVHWGVTHPRASLNDMTSRIDLGFNPTKDSEFGQSPGVKEYLGTSNDALSEQPVLQTYMGLAGDTSTLNLNALEQRMYQLEDVADQDSQIMVGGGASRLLGYGETLLKLSQSPRYTDEQYTLENDLRSERYFIIVRAYDLHASTRSERSRPVWVLHLNTSSPGNNFKTALAAMSEAGARLFGRNTDGVATIRPNVPPKGRVEMQDVLILGEAR